MLKKKRFLALALTVIMLLALVVACTEEATPATPDLPEPITPDLPVAPGAPGYEDDDDVELLEQVVVDDDRGEPQVINLLFTKGGGFEGGPEHSSIRRYIEETNNIIFNQTAPPVANYSEQVAIILASRDLPCIALLYRDMQNDLFDFIDQGAVMDITDMLINEAPSVLENVPPSALGQFTVGGRNFGIPRWSSPHRMNFVVRQNFLDELDLDAPTTLDELGDVMRAFRDTDVGGSGTTFGISGTGLEAVEPIFGAFGVVGIQDTYWFDDNGTLRPAPIHPSVPDALALLRDWHAEGLIDPEFAIMRNEAELNDKAMRNQWGFTYRWWTFEPRLEIAMREAGVDVTYSRIAPPEGPGGANVRGVRQANGVVFVLENALHPDAVARLLEWYHTEHGMMTAFTGVRDLHWEQRADGTFHTLPQFEEDAHWIQWYSLFESEWPLLQIETALVQSRRDAFQWNVITDAADGILVPADLQHRSSLQDFVAETFFSFIDGSLSLETWDDFVDEYLARGAQEWQDQINEAAANRR